MQQAGLVFQILNWLEELYLSPNNKMAKTTVSKGSPVTITLGVVKRRENQDR